MMVTWPYAFESYADAMSVGGHALAAQWATARTKADEGLLAAGVEGRQWLIRVPKPSLKPMTQRRWLPTGMIQGR